MLRQPHRTPDHFPSRRFEHRYGDEYTAANVIATLLYYIPLPSGG